MRAMLVCYAGADLNLAERTLEHGRGSCLLYAEAIGQSTTIYNGLIPLRDIENPLHLCLGIEH